MKRQSLAKTASIISRSGNRFFDQALAPYGIGCGQQFFLVQIAEHEGISMYDLAMLGHFDKTTVTRAVQKLAEVGYVTSRTDESDRRIHRLYITEEARRFLDQLRRQGEEWENILTQDMNPEEIDMVCKLMDKIARNALRYQKGEIFND